MSELHVLQPGPELAHKWEKNLANSASKLSTGMKREIIQKAFSDLAINENSIILAEGLPVGMLWLMKSSSK